MYTLPSLELEIKFTLYSNNIVATTVAGNCDSRELAIFFDAPCAAACPLPSFPLCLAWANRVANEWVAKEDAANHTERKVNLETFSVSKRQDLIAAHVSAR